MKKQISIGEKNLEYILNVSRRSRRVKLAVYCDGNFVVTAPQSAGQNLIEKFIIEKSKWIIDKLEYFKSFGGTTIKTEKGDFLKCKQQTLVLAENRIKYFNDFYGFKYNKINIKNQKTRWGSCSKKGNINFNYKIALLPSHLADYIIVHELCHLGQLNHSRKFWNLVAKTTPNYPKIRKELKKIRIGIC